MRHEKQALFCWLKITFSLRTPKICEYFLIHDSWYIISYFFFDFFYYILERPLSVDTLIREFVFGIRGNFRKKRRLIAFLASKSCCSIPLYNLMPWLISTLSRNAVRKKLQYVYRNICSRQLFFVFWRFSLKWVKESTCMYFSSVISWYVFSLFTTLCRYTYSRLLRHDLELLRKGECRPCRETTKAPCAHCYEVKKVYWRKIATIFQ